MRLFILIFYSIYLTIHLAPWWCVGKTFEFSGKTRWLGRFVCLVLAFTPILTHMLPENTPAAAVKSIHWIVYTWMGVVFYAALIYPVCFYASHAINCIKRLRGTSRTKKVNPAFIHVGSLLIVGIVIFGIFRAAGICRVTEYELSTAKVTRDVNIVMLADLHIGCMSSEKRTEQMVDQINNLNPDLVLYVGDVVNDNTSNLGIHADHLAQLRAPHGILGVYGNHERYQKDREVRDFYTRAGIRVMRDEHLTFNSLNLSIIGVDEPKGRRSHLEAIPEKLENLMPAIQADPRYKIMLLHQPFIFPGKDFWDLYDLQLSGHTHSGQLFPFNLLVSTRYPVIYGFKLINKNSLIVTSGAGAWGPQMRVGAPPEIVLIKLTKF